MHRQRRQRVSHYVSMWTRCTSTGRGCAASGSTARAWLRSELCRSPKAGFVLVWMMEAHQRAEVRNLRAASAVPGAAAKYKQSCARSW